MADPRGGLGSIARNGNSAARTYGAGPRRRTGDTGPARPMVTDGMRPRTVTKVAGGGVPSGATGTPDAGGAPHPAAAADPDPADPDPADPDRGWAPREPRPMLDARGSRGDNGPPRSEPSAGLCAVRRAVLVGLAAGTAALVAGCGGDPAGDAAADPGVPAAQGGRSAPPGGSPTAEQPLEPFPGAEDGGNGGNDAGGNDTGLVKTAEIPVGGAVLVQTYLIAQPQRGVFKAFDATCPHQGITVDPPLGGNNFFMCPGHNSKFRLADGGLISGPAPRGLKQVPVKVRNGYVVEA